MQTFLITLMTVGIMLLVAVPGFILVKSKAVKPESISAFSKTLMYVCQPALTLYSFGKADFTAELGINLLIFFGIITAAQLLFIGFFFFVFRKKQEDIRYRIATVATTMSNCSFLGVPLLEAIFPDSPNVAAYSMMYFLSMNLIGWTLVCAIITRDKKYFGVKKIFINPAVLSIAVALPFFFTGFKLSAESGAFFGALGNMITVLGKMTTPLYAHNGYAACDGEGESAVRKFASVFLRSRKSDCFSAVCFRSVVLLADCRGNKGLYVHYVRLSRGVRRTELCGDFGRGAGHRGKYGAARLYFVDRDVAASRAFDLGQLSF